MATDRRTGQTNKIDILTSLLDEAKSPKSSDKESKPCKILIVEDDPLVVDSIRRAFVNISKLSPKLSLDYHLPEIEANDEHQIRIVNNYEDAKKELTKASLHKALDLVILDLHILETSTSAPSSASDLLGIKLLKDIRRDDLGEGRGYHLSVVILSANVKTTGDHNYGFNAFKDLLKTTKTLVLPDEILLKESEGSGPAYINSTELLKKTAKYLLDLSPREETLLQDPGGIGLIIPPLSVTRRILRQLKGIARCSDEGRPLPDVLLLGENGVGKSTFARAYDLLRRIPASSRIAFSSQDLGSLDLAGSAASLRLFGGTDFADGSGEPEGAWTLGAFSQSTCYQTKPFRRSDGRMEPASRKTFMGQTYFDPGKRSLVDGSNALERSSYPDDDLEPDYEASGTLFLDEVVNVSDEMQARLLQALGYDRTRRHVFTTGRTSRRVPIGPAIIMATRKEIDKMAKEDAGESLAMRDYLFRIDQVRVNIPPLRERRDEIIPYLQSAVKKRYPEKDVSIDERVRFVLMHQLDFRNNFADLERIADQVRPEEDTITFSHVRELFRREALDGLRSKMRERFSTIEGCLEYLKEIDEGKEKPVDWNDLDITYDLRPSEIHNITCSIFIHLNTEIWPTADLEIARYFGKEKTAGAFKAFMSDHCKKINPKLDPKELILLGIAKHREKSNSLTNSKSPTGSTRVSKKRRLSQTSTSLEQ